MNPIEKHLKAAEKSAQAAADAAEKAGEETLRARATGVVAQVGYALEALPEEKDQAAT